MLEHPKARGTTFQGGYTVTNSSSYYQGSQQAFSKSSQASQLRVMEGINQSRINFLGSVWPFIKDAFDSGRIVPTEGENYPGLRLLDTHAHIDYLFEAEDANRSTYGIAARITYGSYRNLTLGITEFEYLRRAVSDPGCIRPAALVHACAQQHRFNGTLEIKAAVIVSVEEFIGWAKCNPGVERYNQSSRKCFLAWPFEELQLNCPSTVVLPYAPKFHFVHAVGNSRPVSRGVCWRY